MEESELLRKADQEGKMDNPKLDPPDVVEVDNNGNTEPSS